MTPTSPPTLNRFSSTIEFSIKHAHLTVESVLVPCFLECLKDFSELRLLNVHLLRSSNVSPEGLDQITTTVVGVITIELGHILCRFSFFLLVDASGNRLSEFLTTLADLKLREIPFRCLRLE